jgi:hypothetical protein
MNMKRMAGSEGLKEGAMGEWPGDAMLGTDIMGGAD